MYRVTGPDGGQTATAWYRAPSHCSTVVARGTSTVVGAMHADPSAGIGVSTFGLTAVASRQSPWSSQST